ncbi:hypothetical protein LJC01_00230 [Clostridiaceae bacterium OttesenSCG-928-D20]|nr:hypothetical protein [Clostridiaceae bacterium OttesenSCG-928-D20]
MIKGLNRRVVIVKSPDPEIFEEAIFIVRSDYNICKGISGKELERQAKRVAEDYVRKARLSKKERRLQFFKKLPTPFITITTATTATLAYLASNFFL